MKSKGLFTVLYALIALIIISYSIELGIAQFISYAGIGIGACITVLAIIVHLVGNDIAFFQLLSVLMNSFAVGLSISSFYVHIEKTVVLSDYITVIAIGAIITMIYTIVTTPNKMKHYRKGFTILFISLSLIITTVLWIQNHEPLFSLLFFYMIIVDFYLGCTIFEQADKEDFMKHMSIASFGSYIIVSFVVLILISEGQALEGLDGIGGTGGKKGKSNQTL